MNGDQLDAGITKLGFNQQSFARCIGIHGRTIQKWISGENDVPRYIAMLVNLMLDTKSTEENLRP